MRLELGALRYAGVLLLVLAGSATAQTDWPTPPDNWWVDLDDGGFPSATFEINMGMPMTITQSVESIAGTQITLSTAVSMMGNVMPGQNQIIDATTLTPEGSIALMQSLGGPPMAEQPTPEEALAAMNATVQRVEDTSCLVGGMELACTLYEVQAEAFQSRVWHAPGIPPVFFGGVVRSLTDLGGQSVEMNMTSYQGTLID